ncbi:MAG: dihydroorotate dehydrogenase [Patescibacteria group bacterium]
MADLTVPYCGVKFPNPLILPSGIAQEIPADHERAIKAGAGGITTKSLTIEPREGNPLPRIAKYEQGFLNSVGLRGPGLVKGKSLIKEFLKTSPVPVIVSVFATKVKDFERFAQELCPLNPQLFELNLSCPNVDDDMGKALGLGCESSATAVSAVKKIAGKVPVLAKLTPNVPNIAEVARACEDAGADGIVAINTAGPGMLIDISRRKPILGAKRGGVSGPAIKPIAVRCVYDIYEAVKIPIIGMGGVSTWEDVIEMMMAGATLVGVGSATYFKGYGVYQEIKQGLIAYMEKEGINNLKELVGVAH